MATVVWKNASFIVNAVDLSNDVSSMTLNYNSEALDATVMGFDTRIRKGGLFDWSMDITFLQDFAAAQVDATLFALVGATACVQIKPVNAAASATNPRFGGVAVLESYPPMTGAVGTLLQATVRFVSAGDLSRNTAAT
mgnify:CR=1 FL=1